MELNCMSENETKKGVPNEYKRPPEWLKDEDFPAIPEEIAEEFGMEQEPQFVLDKALVKLLIRRIRAMIVLKFFFDKNDAFYMTEVQKALGLCQYTVQYNLRKLEQVGLLRSKRFKNFDKSLLYFFLPNSNRKAAEIILKQYFWHVGFQLARYIPYERTTIKQVKADSRFAEKAQYFGLTVDEGIDVVKRCPKVEVKRERDIEVMWRKEQGYVPPEEEKVKKEEVLEVEPNREEVF